MTRLFLLDSDAQSYLTTTHALSLVYTLRNLGRSIFIGTGLVMKITWNEETLIWGSKGAIAEVIHELLCNAKVGGTVRKVAM